MSLPTSAIFSTIELRARLKEVEINPAVLNLLRRGAKGTGRPACTFSPSPWPAGHEAMADDTLAAIPLAPSKCLSLPTTFPTPTSAKEPACYRTFSGCLTIDSGFERCRARSSRRIPRTTTSSKWQLPAIAVIVRSGAGALTKSNSCPEGAMRSKGFDTPWVEFVCLAAGYLLGLLQDGKLSAAQGHLFEAQLPGFMWLHSECFAIS